jgi:hypothetical protein
MRLSWLALIAACIVVPAGAQQAPPDPVRDAAAAAMRTLGLQPTLPHETVIVEPESDWRFHLPDGLLWALAAGAGAMLVYALRNSIPGWGAGRDSHWLNAPFDPANALRASENPLAEADSLAAEDRFVDAMHLLLLHALAEIRRRLAVEFPDSLTSREIARLARLTERGRSALDRIVTRVEWSYFGEHPASRSDYEACRAGVADLTLALEAGRPA